MTFKVKTKGQIEGEILLVPKLRFKGFKDKYMITNINNIAVITMGQSPNSVNYTSDRSDIILIQGNADLNNGKIQPRLYTTEITKMCEINDIIMTVRAPVGDLAITEYKACIGRGVCSIKGSKYLYYYLENFKYKGEWKKLSKGSTIDSITSNDLKNINVTLPDETEQEKISNFLSLLDKKIELQQRKIEALKIYKKGLMQKLINSNNCEEKRISEFGTIITGTTPSKLIQSYWHNGTIVWVTPSDITESKDIYNSHDMLTPDGLKAGRFVPAGSILITCIASIGKNAILKVDGSCNQQINAIIPNKNFNADYLYYLFELKKDYLQSTAGTSATSIINKTSFEKLVFKIHNIEQQNEYSKILNCLESKIETEKHKFKKLTLLKKSLLQQMFI